MGKDLSVKNVPDEIVERLREQAKRNHRSLQGELMAILEQSAEPRKLTVAEALERIKALNFRTKSDSTQMIREDRDAR